MLYSKRDRDKETHDGLLAGTTMTANDVFGLEYRQLDNAGMVGKNIPLTVNRLEWKLQPRLVEHFPACAADERFQPMTPCCVFSLEIRQQGRARELLLRGFQDKANYQYLVGRQNDGDDDNGLFVEFFLKFSF